MKLPSIVPVALFLGPLASALPQSQPVTTYQTLKSYCEATDAVRNPTNTKFHVTRRFHTPIPSILLSIPN